MFLIKKLRKNKVLVLACAVIVMCLVYTGAQKAIDNYIFKSNDDIITESDDGGDTDIEEDGDDPSDGSNDGNSDDETQSESNENSQEGEWEISNEETDLVIEMMSEDVENLENKDGSRAAEESVIENKIYVYITGEVNSPGVVILNEGSRIVDAINAVGGTTAKADISKVNLVYVLDDGMKVNIPNNSDLKNNPDFEYITMNSGDGGSDDYSGNNVSVGIASNSTESSSSGSFKNYSIVNINTATQTELETLPRYWSFSCFEDY